MDIVINYWSQIAVVLASVGLILKTFLDYKIKHKELRNTFFYELKAKKVIEVYGKLVDIQILVDRKLGTENFERVIFSKRMELDKVFWESKFYFNKRTEHSFVKFLQTLKFFEHKETLKTYQNIDEDFFRQVRILERRLKSELL